MRQFLAGRQHTDRLLLVSILLLTILGMVYLYSTGAYYGEARFHDPAYYFKKQMIAVSLGLAVMYGVSRVEYTWIIRFAGLFYVTSLLLSAAVLLVGKEYNGSKRWLAFGPLSFQPSEFAKAAVIFLLAAVISKRKGDRTGFFFAVRIFLLILPIVALVGTNNLSTAVIILGIAAVSYTHLRAHET